jgi:hypothetical protein
MPRRNIRTPKIRSRFLAVLTRDVQRAEACRAVGVCRTAMYRWKNEDAEFSGEWDGVFEGIVDDAYAKMLRQARDDDTIAGVEARKVILRAHMPEL